MRFGRTECSLDLLVGSRIHVIAKQVQVGYSDGEMQPLGFTSCIVNMVTEGSYVNITLEMIQDEMYTKTFTFIRHYL